MGGLLDIRPRSRFREEEEIPAFGGISHVGLSAHTTTDESWRGAPPFGGLRTGFAGLGGVGPRVKHEDDGGGRGEDVRSNLSCRPVGPYHNRRKLAGGARPPFGGLRTGFAGLGGVGPRVKHEDDGGGRGEDVRSNDGGSLLERGHLPHQGGVEAGDVRPAAQHHRRLHLVAEYLQDARQAVGPVVGEAPEDRSAE